MSEHINRSVFDGAKLGVWKIEEEEHFFSNALAISEQERELIAGMRGRRSIEWLSSRHLIHIMSKRDQRAVILKNEYGKPYIDDSDHHISFSHSHGMSAAIASLKVVGVDIQFIVSKIDRIAPKFMNSEEWTRMEALDENKHIEYMHIIWGAKESLFKAYGKKSVDFKKHLNVKINEWNGDHAEFTAEFRKEDHNEDYLVEAQKVDSHILVYAEEI